MPSNGLEGPNHSLPSRNKTKSSPTPAALTPDTSMSAEDATQRLMETESLTKRPIVSFNELKTTGSVAALLALYDGKGRRFKTTEDALETAKKDWRMLCNLEYARAVREPVPTNYPVTKVTLDGFNISIVGIVHSMFAAPDLLVLYRKEVAKYPLLLTEQNLGMRYYSLYSEGLDIPDHFAQGMLHLWKNDMRDMVRAPLQALRAIAARIRQRHHKTERRAPETAEGKILAAFLESAGFSRDAATERASAAILHLSGSIVEQLPAAIDIDYRHLNNMPYTDSQARSAYMAEFLRAWRPDQMRGLNLSQIPASEHSNILSSKAFLCGKGHEDEIPFFLRNGCRDASIVRRAQRDAAILQSGVDKHFAHMASLERRRQALNIATALSPAALILASRFL